MRLKHTTLEFYGFNPVLLKLVIFRLANGLPRYHRTLHEKPLLSNQTINRQYYKV